MDTSTQTEEREGSISDKEKLLKLELMVYKAIYDMNKIMKSMEVMSEMINEFNLGQASNSQTSCSPLKKASRRTSSDCPSRSIARTPLSVAMAKQALKASPVTKKEPDNEQNELEDFEESQSDTEELETLDTSDTLTPKIFRDNGPIIPPGTQMISIGRKGTTVPLSVYRCIEWSSHTYKAAVRTLMMSIFSREAMATSTLTGKPPNSFKHYPNKNILEPSKVEDLVSIVAEKCNIPASLVRTVIAAKCSDEAKLKVKKEVIKKRKRYQMLDNDETE